MIKILSELKYWMSENLNASKNILFTTVQSCIILLHVYMCKYFLTSLETTRSLSVYNIYKSCGLQKWSSIPYSCTKGINVGSKFLSDF